MSSAGGLVGVIFLRPGLILCVCVGCSIDLVAICTLHFSSILVSRSTWTVQHDNCCRWLLVVSHTARKLSREVRHMLSELSGMALTCSVLADTASSDKIIWHFSRSLKFHRGVNTFLRALRRIHYFLAYFSMFADMLRSRLCKKALKFEEFLTKRLIKNCEF